jgi:peptidyl-dipeptidase Dcp
VPELHVRVNRFAIMSGNPLLDQWDTPFGCPPFDRIAAEHFAPAFDLAMAQHLAEIDAIAEAAEPPSFANTIAAMERSGRLLSRVSNVFSNLNASAGSPELRAIDTTYAPLLAAHTTRIALNPGLFRRVAALHAARDTLGLAADELRLLERVHLGFVRSGAALDEPAKVRMAEISQRLATLHTQFGQNVLHDEQAWHLALAPEDLVGLPDFVCAGAAQAAAERGLAGHVITLSRSLILPFLTFSPRRDLRRVAYQAWRTRGEHPGAHDNTKLIPEILSHRAERARLLGYDSYATFRLADTMAGTPEAVARLTSQVWEAGLKRAGQERDRLLQAASADGLNGDLQGWDWLFYAERVRRAEYDIDETEVKQYFTLENMQRAAFDTATRLFGITFVERPDIPMYHPDVRVYDVQDAGRHIALFIADPYARADKRSGAWMSSYRDQENLDGPVTPIIVNTNNFTKGAPSLLSYDDAETLFHEFGHALHGLLSQVRYPSQSGTSVRRDFVELPSQIYEHWLATPETLRGYALHHETGAPIPEALIQRLLAARNFNQGFATVEYTAAAILDMELHTHPDPAAIDIGAFEQETMTRLGMPPEIGVRHRPPHFQHLFAGAGYAAGYYSYLWAEVLDADGFAAFEEAGDAFDPTLAARLKRILQSGDMEDPMQLYISFRGREPGIEALLKHRGLG